LFCWLFITIFLVLGPRAIEMKALITVPLRFALIIIFVVKFANLNSDVDGQGIGWYLGGAAFPKPTPVGEVQDYV